MVMIVAPSRFLDPATVALVARMTGAPTGGRVTQIDALVRSLKTGGVWAKVDCLYLLAAHDAQAARLNWKQALYDATAVNSPTFVTDRGYTGDGATSYLETGYMFPAGYQNSAHLMAWSRGAAAEANFTAIGNANSVLSIRRSLDDGTFTRINSATAFSVTTTDGSGGFISSRTGATSGDFALYRNGSAQSLIGGAASEVPDATYSIHGLGRNGPLPAFAARQFAAFSMGQGLTSGEAAAFHAALNTYLTAIGAA